ncbi:hypothetical protein UFOVP1605_51 [uncultured Caudovirales phage]|uniref:Uncharacterized protein n=1 Tax=uncultured Caudovirales phage TaxID=2100421 RepID=A0A6J5SV11_9CAUD|nr:hypothetical protein UFOVP1605_51 [uncultured Caudovirales phage]
MIDNHMNIGNYHEERIFTNTCPNCKQPCDEITEYEYVVSEDEDNNTVETDFQEVCENCELEFKKTHNTI